MRVLQIIDSLNRGGAEVMLTAMAPRFRDAGCYLRCRCTSANILARLSIASESKMSLCVTQACKVIFAAPDFLPGETPSRI